MSANTAIKTAEQRLAEIQSDGWTGMNIAAVRERLKDEERAELRTALEAAQQQLAQRGGSGEAKPTPFFWYDPTETPEDLGEVDRDNGNRMIRLVCFTKAPFGYAYQRLYTAPPAAVQPDDVASLAVKAAYNAGYDAAKARQPDSGRDAALDIAVEALEYYADPKNNTPGALARETLARIVAMAAQPSEQAPAAKERT